MKYIIYIEKYESALTIITKISDDLLLYLNEKYIIEEYLLIIDVANKDELKDIEFSKNILNKLKKLSNIIQTKDDNYIEELISSFNELNKYIIKELDKNQIPILNEEDEINEGNRIEEKDKNDDEYYNLLANFYLKELKRLNDINYKSAVLEQILVNDKIIKKSLESFKVLLKSILQPELEKFEKILSNLKTRSDDIFQMIEKNESSILDETLLYLFEKNSFIYFEKAASIEDKKIKEKKFNIYYEKNNPIYIIFDESLSIFKNCISYLENPDDKTKNKKLKKLFCLAYIRVYIYKFIHIFNENFSLIDPNPIIKAINGEKETKFRFMLKLYLYKIIFNIFGHNMEIIRSKKIQQKFYLNDFENYKNFLEKDESKIYLEEFLLPKESEDIENFEDLFLRIKSYENNNYKSIDIGKIKEDISKYGEDIFYIICANLLSPNLFQIINYNNESTSQNNFWNNIIEKVFKKDIKKKLLKILFNVEDIKKLNHNNNLEVKQIEMLLYSMRFCFKTLSSEQDDCVYKKLLLGDNDCLSESYFIGSDMSEKHYYDIYLKLNEHFKKDPKKSGAYVCLCQKGSYQYIPPNGYPTDKNLNEKCKHCSYPIGSKKIRIKKTQRTFLWFYKEYYEEYIRPIKREGYVRIFKDQTEIENEPYKLINGINYMSLNQFKESKINQLILDERPGVVSVSSHHFKKTNKMIRYIKSQITYRLLNFILYSHLFFSEIMNKKFKFNLPDNMNIIDVLEEDWNQLKKALGRRNIKVFLNLIFKELTDELIQCNEISEIKDLFNIEEKLENIILNSLRKYDEYEEQYNILNSKLRKVDFDSTSALLSESYDYSLYKE